MAKACIILRTIKEGEDDLFATANFNYDGLEIQCNFTDLGALISQDHPSYLSFSEEERKILQRFLNDCWPEDK